MHGAMRYTILTCYTDGWCIDGSRKSCFTSLCKSL